MRRFRVAPTSIRFVSFASFVLLVLLSSCSARQEFFVETDGSGRAEIEIVVDPVLANYVSDLGAGMGRDEMPLFDPPAISAAFASYPELDLLSVETPDAFSVRIRVAFASLDALFAGADDGAARSLEGIVQFVTSDTERQIVADVDRRGVEGALAYAQFDPSVTGVLLPPAGEMSGDEYRDYLAWAMEEYEGDTPLPVVFERSRVETVVRVNGTIIEVSGGRRDMGDAALFSTALLEILTTAVPERYGVTFRAR